jgi:hypothetical protein
MKIIKPVVLKCTSGQKTVNLLNILHLLFLYRKEMSIMFRPVVDGPVDPYAKHLIIYQIKNWFIFLKNMKINSLGIASSC